MNFEDLDKDTQNIIDEMCIQTGRSREQSILALVEFGMVAMQAAIAENTFFINRKKNIMQVVFDAITADEAMVKTAESYASVWHVDI